MDIAGYIGGMTVEELKERMSYDEFLGWSAYIRKNGALNPGLRMEWCAALISHMLALVNGNKKSKIADYLPNRMPPEEEFATIGDVFRILKTAKKGKHRGK